MVLCVYVNIEGRKGSIEWIGSSHYTLSMLSGLLCYLASYRESYIFWIDFAGDKLYRSYFNGSQSTVLVNTSIICSGIYIAIPFQ